MSILVSISCITYNHVNYIKACLDGFLMQKTSFPIEVIIYDDCSTDGTRAIIEAYAAAHPHLIFPMFQKENQYSKGIRGINARFNFPRCKGKYIAFCEGDDYWTDPNKLQQQVNFLESHPDHVISCHNVAILYPNGVLKNNNGSITEHQNSYSINDLALGTVDINTLSVMCRNQFVHVPFSVYFTLPIGDYPLWLFLSTKGLIHYSPLKMAVYRVHDNGVWSSKKAYQRCLTTITTIEKISESFDPEVQLLLNRQVLQLHKKALKSTFNAVEDCEKMLDIFYHFDKKALAECIMDEVKQNKNVVATRKSFRHKVVAFIKRMF